MSDKDWDAIMAQADALERDIESNKHLGPGYSTWEKPGPAVDISTPPTGVVLGCRTPDPPLPYYSGGRGWSHPVLWREPPIPRPRLGSATGAYRSPKLDPLPYTGRGIGGGSGGKLTLPLIDCPVKGMKATSITLECTKCKHYDPDDALHNYCSKLREQSDRLSGKKKRRK